MKKLLIGILILGGLGAGAYFYLSSNAGNLVKDGVVEYVPPVIGADVQLASVDLNAQAGTASLNGMVIGNTEGFESEHLFKMDQFSMSMDTSLDNITSDVIRIQEVRLEGADMIYEIGTEGNNVGKIQENIAAYIQQLGLDSDSESEKKFIIDDVYVNGTNVKVASDLLGGRGLGFSLPDIHLQGIGERGNGVIASGALGQGFDAISGKVTEVAQTGVLDDVLGGVVSGAEEAAGNVVKELEDEVGDKIKSLIPPIN